MSDITLRKANDIEWMRKSGEIAHLAMEQVRKAVRPGITTQQLDRIAEDVILAHEAKPAFKGLYGFPGTACISVNDEVVHGIPSPSCVLEEGDIVSIDLGAILNGWYSDHAATFAVGVISPKHERLIRVTEECFWIGFDQAAPHKRVGDISYAIQRHAESHGYGVVRALTGHGVGRALHEKPDVPNFGQRGSGEELLPGMTFAIEPMINLGTYRVKTDSDGWTVRTADRKYSSHYEHTIVITETGADILTGRPQRPEGV